MAPQDTTAAAPSPAVAENPTPSGPPSSIPWYRSQIIVGVLTAVVVQVAAHVQARYHIDLAAYGVTADQAVGVLLDAASAAAAAWAVHGRVTQNSAPAITLTKPSA